MISRRTLCGICGYISSKDITKKERIISMSNNMTSAENTVFAISENIAIGNKKLKNIDSITIDSSMYIVSFEGIIYNIDEILNILEKNYVNIENLSIPQTILYLYNIFNYSFVDHIDGNFVILIYDGNKKRTILVRDRLGIKPVFFATNNTVKKQYIYIDSAIESEEVLFAFSSEINSLLEIKEIKRVLGKDELLELLALGPSHTPFKTYFKGIYSLMPGHYIVFENNELKDYTYWDLIKKSNTDSNSNIINTVKSLVTDSLNRDIISSNKENLCFMLSGGLDSSILCSLGKNKLENINTTSVDFLGNDLDFKSGNYQPSKDSDYVKIMVDFLQSKHSTIYLTHEELFNNLYNAMSLRGMPGMADIDSSMLVFTQKIKELGFDTAISGECADEIFGGYPWFYKKELQCIDSFPFSRSVNERTNLINKNLVNSEDVKNYISKSFSSTFNTKDFIENSDNYTIFDKTCYLTIKWFMSTLIERTERMTLLSDLDVRTPYANYKLFEYIYNVSSKLKLGLINDASITTEKYVLRKAFEDILPEKICYRKKSPFPKTYDEKYLSLLEEEIKHIIQSSTAPVLELLDIKYLIDLLYTKGEKLSENWYGQLMTYPETLAYIIQINMWLAKYNIEIDI